MEDVAEHLGTITEIWNFIKMCTSLGFKWGSYTILGASALFIFIKVVE